MEIEPDPPMKWKRLNFDTTRNYCFESPEDRRQLAERETNRDLKKPLEQLVCDVHEESDDPNRTSMENLIGAQKRMVSMMARVAKSNDNLAWQMWALTWAITIMTAVILVFTILMWL